MSKSKILIVDDDPAFCLMLATFLDKNGFESCKANTAKECLNILEKSSFSLVITDLRLPDFTGIEVLRKIKSVYPKTPVILMTGYGEIKTAVQAIKLGAYEYVTKPVNPDEILLMVNSALNPVDTDTRQYENSEDDLQYLTGTSEVSAKLEHYIDLVAPTSMSVLIRGESGTGKEWVARKIHQLSDRTGGPFIALDCGALSNELAASELFGHEKGSFTGAINDKVGQFEMANGGTLFLDEIGNLSYDVQIKLLRALQEKTIKKVGGKKEVAVNVRIIAASNEDLHDSVNVKGFREDLYHRLNEFTLDVPSLRERGADIGLFADYFLDRSNQELSKRVLGFSEQVKLIFQDYFWPGNIREMKNIIKRAVLLCTGTTIEEEHLPIEIAHRTLSSTAIESNDLRKQTEYQEREIIISTLKKTRYNKSKAADLLNIDRKTLYNKMKQYEIDH